MSAGPEQHFFFSSRRRHTRLTCDWSSDVCSSDLAAFARVTFVCNPDEEVGSPFSGPLIREIALESNTAFVLEAGRENGDIVSARKGITSIRAELSGRAAHAGVEPEKGRHAVLDAAMKTVELQALNGRFEGVTVNVGVLSGGTRPNVVPDRCVMEVDVRAWKTAALEEATRH